MNDIILQNGAIVINKDSKIKIEKINKKIIPSYFILNNEYFKILEIDLPYIINGYYVRVIDQRILSIILCGVHPNADLYSGLLCLPKPFIGKHFNEKFLNIIENRFISIHNLDNSYFIDKAIYLKYEKVTHKPKIYIVEDQCPNS